MKPPQAKEASRTPTVLQITAPVCRAATAQPGEGRKILMTAAFTKPDGKIHSIEGLRFFAAFLVVLYHCYFDLTVPPGLDRSDLTGPVTWFKNGELGVDIFFVISGLVMYITASRRPVFDARAFMIDRFWRIYPVLWVALLVKIALELVTFSAGIGSFDAVAMEPGRILLQLLLVPLPLETLLIPPTWTLSLEIIFYAIFAAGFLIAGVRGVLVAVLAWFLIAALYSYGLGRPNETLALIFKPIILEFSYGVGIGYLYCSSRLRYGKTVLLLGSASMFAVLFLLGNMHELGIPREFLAGIPAGLLVYGLAATRPRIPRWLLLGGRASYVLYLFHGMTFGVVVAVFDAVFGVSIWDHQILVVLPVAAALIVAVTLNVFLENPFQQWRRRRRQSATRQDHLRGPA